MKRIILPSSLDLGESLKISILLSKIENADKYVFDFQHVKRVEPFGLLFVSSEIQRLRSRHPDSEVGCQNYSKMNYAGHMGFFKSFGLDHGKFPGQARGSNNYIPMRLIDCSELTDSAYDEGAAVGDIVERESEQLAEVLCCQDKGPIHETLTYSLREIMRNVVEHSEASQIGICAQLWPSKNLVEVAILDRGVGLRATLSRNPHLDVTNDKAALNYSLMPAVSGKAFKGAKNKQKGPWANSGFGLYMTSRICRNGGMFFIASRKHGMLLTSAGGKRYFDCEFSGTAVRLRIQTNKISSLNKSLEKYRSEGFEIQKTYKEIVNIDPSAASLMMSRDFDLSLWKKALKAIKNT